MSSYPSVALGMNLPANATQIEGQQASVQDLIARAQLAKQQTAQNAALAPGVQQQQQQDIQMNAQKIAEQDFIVKDRAAGTAAMKQWDGKDPNQIPDLIKANGGSLQAVMNAKAGVVKQQQDVANMTKAQLENNKSKNDYLLGKLQSATDTSVPDGELAGSVMQATNDAIKDGYLDPQHAQEMQQIVAQFPNPADLRTHLAQYEKSMQSQSEQFAQASKTKENETAAVTAQARELVAKNTATNQEMQRQQAATAETERARHNQATETIAAGGGTAGQVGGLSDDALNAAADKYNGSGGVLPSMGMGSAGAATRKAIINRAAERAPNADLTTNSAGFKVAGSPAQVAFFGSAKSLTDKGGTLDQLQSQSAKLQNGKIPLFNKVSDYVSYQSGDPAMAGFMQTAIGAADDYAKVMGGGTGSDSARLSVLQSFSNAHNPAQMKAAIDAARGAVGSQIKSRIGNNAVMQKMYNEGAAPAGGGQTAPQGAGLTHVPGGKASGLTEGATGKGSDGKKYVVKGGVWHPAQ